MEAEFDYERRYRDRVAVGTRAARAPLPMVFAAIAFASAAAVSELKAGDAGSAATYVALFAIGGTYFLSKAWGSATAWVPRSTERGIIPGRRGYFDAVRGRPPPLTPWESVVTSTIEPYGPSVMTPHLQGKPRYLQIATNAGRQITLEYVLYPGRFNQICAQLDARGLLKASATECDAWIPAAAALADSPAPPTTALVVTQPEDGGVIVIGDPTKFRRSQVAWGAVLLVIFVWFIPTVAYFLNSPDPTVGFLSVVLSALIIYLSAASFLKALRATRVECDGAEIRVPKHRFPYRRLALQLREIPLVAVEPTDEAEAAAFALIAETHVPGRARVRLEAKVARWMAVGGILVVASADVWNVHATPAVQGRVLGLWSTARARL